MQLHVFMIYAVNLCRIFTQAMLLKIVLVNQQLGLESPEAMTLH